MRALAGSNGKTCSKPQLHLAERIRCLMFLLPGSPSRRWSCKDPGYAATFVPNGRPVGIGETLRQPALALSLRRIAEEGADAFYRGAIAHALDAYFKEHGGLLRASDLAAYAPLWVEPIACEYRGHLVHAMPPNSCGALLLMQLNGLSAVDSGVLASNPALRTGYQMSAMRRGLRRGRTFLPMQPPARRHRHFALVRR
jgi:gamma-glutamyltranspeptidase/glutathione hydrolase